MKIVVFLILMLLTLLSGCENKSVNLFPTFEKSIVFPVKTTDFDFIGVIKGADIQSAIDKYLRSSDDVGNVSLEAVWFEIRPKENNTASSVKIDLCILSENDRKATHVLDDYVMAIRTGNSMEPVLSGLKSAGVTELLKQLDAIVNGQAKDLRIDASGVVSPEGAEVNVEIELFIRGVVEVSQDIKIF